MVPVSCCQRFVLSLGSAYQFVPVVVICHMVRALYGSTSMVGIPTNVRRQAVVLKWGTDVSVVLGR